MVIWKSILVLFLVSHGGYSKPQDKGEGQLEGLRRELIDLNEEELRYVLEGLKSTGKLKTFINTRMQVVIVLYGFLR